MRKNELHTELAEKLAKLSSSYLPRLSHEEIARSLICGAVVTLENEGEKTEEEKLDFLYCALDLAIAMAMAHSRD